MAVLFGFVSLHFKKERLLPKYNENQALKLTISKKIRYLNLFNFVAQIVLNVPIIVDLLDSLHYIMYCRRDNAAY